MSIILSATAFECELSRLFAKWKGIEAVSNDVRGPNEAEIEETLRNFGNVREKIEKVGQFLHPGGLDHFTASSHDLTSALVNFPSLHLGSLARDFQERLFWPRNRILHFGYTASNQTDAEKCYNIANFGLWLLRDVDRAKRAELDRRGWYR